jgi:histidyl-tRNA synthetase
MSKPSLARGTRDFGPEKMLRRNFIFDKIKTVFQKFGFLQIETPSIENLSVLMGKYGEEGDQLLFKILNSGDFLSETKAEDLEAGYKKVLPKISEKGLRYDLTVPFARFVVMNRNDLVMPFKRYQIQPVWRADRPQRGRYREFYQCDADVVGTDSLLCEAEIVLMLQEIFQNLSINAIEIKINNRKILTGIAEIIGLEGQEANLCVAIDKLDKIGKEKVEEELLEKGFTAEAIQKLQPLFENRTSNASIFEFLTTWLASSTIGSAGVEELKRVLDLVESFGASTDNVKIDITLARGLSYYTGAIFEVKALGVQIGSISGGGRYDDLTGSFGAKGLSGVGISLGVDRIYDVMEELDIFPVNQNTSTQVLITNFDTEAEKYGLPILKKIREQNIKAELYPDYAKLKKQFDYADKKKIPFVIVIGSEEMQSGILTIKNMETGEQEKKNIEEILKGF